MLSCRLLVLSAAFVVACGDASIGTSDHWAGIGTGSGDNGGGDPPAGSDSGSSGGGGTDGGVALESGTQTSSISVMTDQTSYNVELRATVAVQVTIAPKNFTGTINLTTTGLPTGATGTFAPATLNVSGNTGATSVLTVTTLSSVPPAAAPFQIVATSGSTTANAAPQLTVMPQITIQIPMNVEAEKGTSGSPSTNAFGDYPILITAPKNLSSTNPVNVVFVNNDSAPHCIHASNSGQGFPHDAVNNGVCNTLMNKGDTDKTTHPVNTLGSYLFYLHDQGDLTDGMIKLQ